MRKLDMFWMSNREWWTFENNIPVLKENAPPEACASYKRYLEQSRNEARRTEHEN